MVKISDLTKILVIQALIISFCAPLAGAIQLNGAVGEMVETKITYTIGSGVKSFYLNDTEFKKSTTFYYDESSNDLFLTMIIPSKAVGTYPLQIMVDRAYSGVNSTYTKETNSVASIELTITSTPQKIKETTLPNGGLIEEGRSLSSSAGFSIIPQNVGEGSVIVNTINCNENAVPINYGGNHTFKCASDSCDVKVNPSFKFTDSGGTNFVKMKIYTNCYTHSISTNTTSIGGCNEIKIQPTGTATRGQNLLISTRTNLGKPVKSNVLITDSSPHTEDTALVTNIPWDGLGKIYIDEASIPPLTILARSEELDCEGTYVITDLGGQLISPEEQQTSTENMKTLVIAGIPEEVIINTIIEATLTAGDDTLTDLNSGVLIEDPNQEKLKTGTNLNGKFSFTAGKIGTYNIKAIVNGYKNSTVYSMKVREPRKQITIGLFSDGRRIFPTEDVIVGQEIDIVVYEGDCSSFDGTCSLINESVVGSVVAGGVQYSIPIDGGMGEFVINSTGVHSISVPESYSYMKKETSANAVEGYDWTMVIFVIVLVVVVIIIFIIIVKRKGGSSSSPEVGYDPGATGVPPGEQIEEFDVEGA